MQQCSHVISGGRERCKLKRQHGESAGKIGAMHLRTATIPTLLADNRDSSSSSSSSNYSAVFYSDDSALEVCVLDDTVDTFDDVPPCSSTIAPLGLETISSPFPSANDAAFLAMQEVCAGCRHFTFFFAF